MSLHPYIKVHRKGPVAFCIGLWKPMLRVCWRLTQPSRQTWPPTGELQWETLQWVPHLYSFELVEVVWSFLGCWLQVSRVVVDLRTAHITLSLSPYTHTCFLYQCSLPSNFYMHFTAAIDNLALLIVACILYWLGSTSWLNWLTYFDSTPPPHGNYVEGTVAFAWENYQAET